MCVCVGVRVMAYPNPEPPQARQEGVQVVTRSDSRQYNIDKGDDSEDEDQVRKYRPRVKCFGATDCVALMQRWWVSLYMHYICHGWACYHPAYTSDYRLPPPG